MHRAAFLRGSDAALLQDVPVTGSRKGGWVQAPRLTDDLDPTGHRQSLTVQLRSRRGCYGESSLHAVQPD